MRSVAMSPRIRSLAINKLAVILLGLMAITARADSDSPASKTILEIEILQPANGSLALDAQKWRQVFEKLDVGVTIRSPMSGEKPGLTETPRGPFRIVRLIGVLDRSGAVVFPGRSFAQTQSTQLKEWLDELRVYGAQGSPRGKP